MTAGRLNTEIISLYRVWNKWSVVHWHNNKMKSNLLIEIFIYESIYR